MGIKAKYLKSAAIEAVGRVASKADLTAYVGAATTIQTPEGRVFNKVVSSATVDNDFVLPVAGDSASRWLWSPPNGVIEVDKIGIPSPSEGITNAATAIQKAITYAKTLTATYGGMYRAVVQLPAGQFRLTSTVNCTEMNGVIVRGSSRGYGTVLTGCTSGDGTGQGIMFDFTGSTFASLENVFLSIDSAWGASTSKIAVMYALGESGGNQTGGLRCTMKDVIIQCSDMPSVNGGLGTIGLVCVASEEFAVQNCSIKANLPVLLSNKRNLADMGYADVTLTSPYATVRSVQASQGVNSFTGQMTLLGVNRRQPAMILNGVNEVHFHGYIGRENVTASAAGNNIEYAILTCQSTYEISISGTIESYPTIIRSASPLEGCELKVSNANLTDASKPLIDVTNAGMVSDLRAYIKIPNAANPDERSSRFLLYHDPISGGDEPSTTIIRNSVVSCPHIINNLFAVSQPLLKRSDNLQVLTAQPFVKQGNVVRSLFTNKVSLGTHKAVNDATGVAFRFRQCDRTTTALNNGGYYRAVYRGILWAGTSGSGGNAVATFTATFLMAQATNSGLGNVDSTIFIEDGSTTAGAYINVTDINVTMTFDGTFGYITVTPTTTGNGVGEPISVSGTLELATDFYVNEAIPLA